MRCVRALNNHMKITRYLGILSLRITRSQPLVLVSSMHHRQATLRISMHSEMHFHASPAGEPVRQDGLAPTMTGHGRRASLGKRAKVTALANHPHLANDAIIEVIKMAFHQ